MGEVMGIITHTGTSLFTTHWSVWLSLEDAGALVDGHGNFGSPDDDPPARCVTRRQGEPSRRSLRISNSIRSIGNLILMRKRWSQVLPALPQSPCERMLGGFNRIRDGNSPHNLGEVIDAIALIDKPTSGLDALMEHVKGPDFPTGGLLMGMSGLRQAYETGRGKVIVQGRWEVEKQPDGKRHIIISEVPYGTNKARMVAQMESLRADKAVHGMLDARDESDREGTRVVVELSKSANVDGVLGLLLKKTSLQVSFNFNMVAIHKKSPRCMGLKDILLAYIEHQKDVVTRRSRFLLETARHRLHIVEGLIAAVDILDEVIATIRASEDRKDARANLIERFSFSEIQADAILDLRLHRLTGLQFSIENRAS